MKKIASFTVDHLRLQPGIYVSRRDRIGAETITTFDLRMTSPNEEPVMNTAEVHTIEHLGATFLRNHPDWADRVHELSAEVTFAKVYERMNKIKVSLEDPTNPKGRAGNDTRDAYARLLDRLQAFERPYSIEHKLFATSEGLAVDDVEVGHVHGVEAPVEADGVGVHVGVDQRGALRPDAEGGVDDGLGADGGVDPQVVDAVLVSAGVQDLFGMYVDAVCGARALHRAGQHFVCHDLKPPVR